MAALEAGHKGSEAFGYLTTLKQDPNPLVRRAAIRSLGTIGAPAIDLLLVSARSDEDILARRSALRALARIAEGKTLVSILIERLEDENELVRMAAIEELAAIQPRSPEILSLLREARNDPSPLVSRTVAAFLWPYHGEVASARERSEFRDSHLDATRLDLPATSWRFVTDPQETGHVEGWITTTYDDSGWDVVSVGQPWQNFGYRHRGVAWYRLSFELPREPQLDAADLVFEGVDESAWIWINGEFVGTHDLGSEGYNKAFAVDTRDLLQWGKLNQLTVRVSKTTGNHAGIWKPVYLEILRKP